MENSKLAQSNLEKIGSQVVDDPSFLLSTWPQRAWLGCGCISLFICLAKCIIAAANSKMWLEPISFALFGYLMADLVSGIFHWAVDNYGDASTPFFGYHIDAFVYHHQKPAMITKNEFANLNFRNAQTLMFILFPIGFACNDPAILAFVGTFFGCAMFGLQIHAWAHGNKTQLPSWVVALQRIGVLVSPIKHSLHHRPPFCNNYCMVSGVCNVFMDKLRVFEAMEVIIFGVFGVKPRSWVE
ncbi:hypothetical protein AQUCO_04200010v1 [Aquilegia coerulea]|uniref:Lipid desaturase domain-containing protein n=1 Tax=Aquilegia coerulea TaxID=218851 RepID=A0A2G5CNT7_AQUCA|nr:hypothetical protein AQUCO_04200010v1 [Aquilegia coerulea]